MLNIEAILSLENCKWEIQTEESRKELVWSQRSRELRNLLKFVKRLVINLNWNNWNNLNN